MYKLKAMLFLIMALIIGAMGCATNQQQVVKEESIEKSMEESKEFRWVSAKAGLKVRNEPGTSAEKIGAIAFATKVTLISEKGDYLVLAGRKGKWSKVSWSGRNGWVFGGFLSKEVVTEKEE